MGFVQLVFLGAICLAQFLGFYGHFITQSSLNSPHPPALMGSLLSSAKPSREIKKNIKKNKNPIQLFREEEAGGIQGKPRQKKNNKQHQPKTRNSLLVWLDPSLLFHAQVAFSSSPQPREEISWEIPDFLASNNSPNSLLYPRSSSAGGRQGRGGGERLWGNGFSIFFFSPFPFCLSLAGF